MTVDRLIELLCLTQERRLLTAKQRDKAREILARLEVDGE